MPGKHKKGRPLTRAETFPFVRNSSEMADEQLQQPQPNALRSKFPALILSQMPVPVAVAAAADRRKRTWNFRLSKGDIQTRIIDFVKTDKRGKKAFKNF